MPSHDWTPVAGPAAPLERPRQLEPRRGWLELALAISGFAAWSWCAFEVVKSFL